tara:strand:- start:317 stop:532 length:216 start_codon:yes stop_codon:yes gene_type:complete
MGIFNKILGSILKSRTETVLKAFADHPELKKNAIDIEKAIKKFDKSITEASDINQKKLKKAGVPRITAFDD